MACGDQSPTGTSTDQERVNLLIPPYIIDHQQHRLSAGIKGDAQAEPRLLRIGHRRPLHRQRFSEIVDLRSQGRPGDISAELSPQQSAGVPGNHRRILDRLGHQRRLPESAGTLHRGYRHRRWLSWMANR
ncbi:hypothetical protein GCM10009558_011810 [Virgisporangium aurantiacum]